MKIKIEAQKKWNSIAKPLNSLGKLESGVVQLATIFNTLDFDISKKCNVVMCADNGIVEEGVTQTGKEVTQIVANNMVNGNSTVSIMCKMAKADLFVVDIGMAAEIDNPLIINKKIMFGTNNFFKEWAMTKAQAEQAISVGIEMVKHLKEQGYKIISTGEMGIGNTTSSSAVAACLLNKEVAEVTGRGAGLTTEGFNRKIFVIEEAIKKHKPDKNDPIDVLAKVGGLDIAGLVGMFIGAMECRLPIIIDGFISSVAALIAIKINENTKDYMFASHVSKEPAGRMLLEELKLPYYIDADMCLGEGTGAVLLFNILDMAVGVFKTMADFEEAKVDAYVPLD